MHARRLVVKLFSFVTLFSLLFVSSPLPALADGMVVWPDPYSNRWDYAGETNQQVYINYESGREKMIVSIGLESNTKDKLLWLFPVPANPEKVVVDVVSSLPQLRGQEVSQTAKRNLEGIGEFLRATQIVPAILESLLGIRMTPSVSYDYGAPGIVGSLNQKSAAESDVVVYEHLEKQGITTEIVTAKTANGLSDYLKTYNLSLEKGSIPVLDQYMGEDFSFIVSWITPKVEPVMTRTEIENRLQNYFSSTYINPSTYPSMYSFYSLFQKKHPELIQDGKKYLSSTEQYTYLKNNPEIMEELISEITANPSVLKTASELRPTPTINQQKGLMVTFPTKKIYFPLKPTSVYGSKTVPATIRIIGFVSPMIYEDIKSYTTVEYYTYNYYSPTDLTNFYSPKGGQTKYTRIDINAPSKLLSEDLEVKNVPPLKPHYSAFVAQHQFIFGLFIFLIANIIAGLFSGFIIFRETRKSLRELLKYAVLGLFNFLSIIGLIIATVIFRTKIIKEEDKSLFKELEDKGYSTGGFRSQDSRKIAFIPLFSVSFLIASWILIKLVEITL